MLARPARPTALVAQLHRPVAASSATSRACDQRPPVHGRTSGGGFRESIRRRRSAGRCGSETEMFFGYVVQRGPQRPRLDRQRLHLPERAARQALRHQRVTGDEMRKVSSRRTPARRRLTQATVLIVTSNPTRTSPVKRGRSILDNILGTPPPPPPPDVPAAGRRREGVQGPRADAARDHGAAPREAAVPACHARMDPLGLALENFNALGMWRDKEREPADRRRRASCSPARRSTDMRELKQILQRPTPDRLLPLPDRKVLTYALGRGLEYYDVRGGRPDRRPARREDGTSRPCSQALIESARSRSGSGPPADAVRAARETDESSMTMTNRRPSATTSSQRVASCAASGAC